MKCPNPDCRKEIESDSKFCRHCGGSVEQAREFLGDSGGLRTGDIGYVEGNITDKSTRGSASVGSISINVEGAKEKQSPGDTPSIVTCQICGRRNELMTTFKCLQCHKDHLCLQHQDAETNLCQMCTTENKTRARIESLESEIREAEAEKDLKWAVAKMDVLIELVEDRQASLDWKARLEQELAERREADRKKLSTIFENDLGMKFILLPAGTFWMGLKNQQHRVRLTQDFYMQTTPVTQGQWQAIIGSNPSRWGQYGSNCPVENISWNEAQEFIQKLNTKENTTKYRLPTEAEWEYACRAGSDTVFCFGDFEADLDDYGWYYANSDGHSHPVGQKRPNAWGLYDLHGNVYEWCQDRFDWEYHPSKSVTDPQGPSSGSDRIYRGGSYALGSYESGSRSSTDAGRRWVILGFRLARTF